MKNRTSFKNPNIAIPLLERMRKFEVPIRPEIEKVVIVEPNWFTRLLIRCRLLETEIKLIVPTDIWERAYRSGFIDNYRNAQDFFLRKKEKSRMCSFHRKRKGNCSCI